MDNLAYGDPAPDTDKINLDTSNVSPLPDNVLSARASRADYALGDKSPGIVPLRDAFRSGQEPQIRQTAAADANSDFQQDKLNHIKAATQQGTPVTDKQVNDIMAIGTTPEANPDTVLEDKFAKNVVSTGVIGDPSTNLVFQSAFDVAPDKTRDGVQIATGAISRKHQAMDVLEQTQAAWNDLPYLNASDGSDKDQTMKAGSFLANVFSGGIAQYVNQRNLLNSSPTNSFLPGSNKLEQIQYLYLLPHDQFKPALMAAAGPGSPLWKTSPGDALDFVKSAVQFSTSDAYADNLMGVANVAGVLPIGTALKGIGVLRNGRAAKGVADAAFDLSQVQSTADAILREGSAPPKTLLKDNGMTAAMNGLDILSESSKPPTPGYYVPKAAVTKEVFPTANKGQIVPRNITTQVGADNVPHVFNEDGIEVALKRTPEEGHLPVSVSQSEAKPTFTTRGGTFEHNDQTIYVDKNGADRLSKVLDTEGGRKTILEQPDGRYSVGDLDNVSPGKTIRGTITSVERTPSRGLYPVELTEDGPKFGQRITRVNEGESKKVSFGPEITSQENVQARVALADIVKSQAESHPQDVLGKMGLHEAAATQAAAQKIDDNFQQIIHSGDTEEIRRQVPSLASPQLYFNNASSLTRERADRLAQNAIQASLDLTQAVTDPARVERMTTAAKDRAIEIAKTQVREKYNRNADAILDQITHWDSSSNLYSVETRFGKKDGTLFDTSASATFAKDMQYKLGQSGVVKPYAMTPEEHVRIQNTISMTEHQVARLKATVNDPDLVARMPADTIDHYREQIRVNEEGIQKLQARLDAPTATVSQEGNQFFISHMQHVDETQSGVRDSLIISGNETPRGWWNSMLTAVTGRFAPLGNSIRSSASTLAPFQMNNRVISTHAPSIMRDAIENVAKDIQSLGGKWTTSERQEMQTILEHNRDYMSPNGVRGQFYKSALEFETAFNGHFGFMPSEKQIVAYDQFTRLSDLDWTLRELDLMRDKARQGVRNYQVTFLGKDELGIPSKMDTKFFNGKLVKDFDPVNTQDANVYVMPMGKFTTKFDLKDASAVSKQINDKLKSGEYQIIQMYNPREKPLMETTGVKDDVHFVVTDKYKDKPIVFGENAPYRPGGHVIYQDQHYIKQPQVGQGTNGRVTHFGDTTIKAFSTEREAKEWADKYNTVRELIHNGDDAGLQAYMNAGHLPETLPEIKRMFSDGTLSTDAPIVHTFAGRDTFQSNEALAMDERYRGLKDQFSSYNLSQVQGGDFLADRGAQLNTVANKGTEANPLYTNVPSRLFDPYTALQKGMAQIVRSRWMSDYKISAAESWVQEFGHLFDQSKLPLEKLRQNPTYWLYHAEGNIDAGVMKTNPELVTAAMTSRKNIMNFIGSRDEVGSIMEGLQKKVIDKIAGYSPNLARKTEETYLPAITNAPAYAREATFNAVIGMFNPVQLYQQAQGLVHAYALAPTHAWQSTTASALMRMYRYTEDPAILASAADKAVAMGWGDKQSFLDAVDAWKRSGVHNIGGETALLSTTGDPQLFRNGLQTFLNKGQMFFKAGESIVRDTSWFTATREWQAANPGKAIDNRALGDIGNRFQVLSLDMTRASNSALNEGVLSIPTQFWTWNARFAEQMIGKRLTMGEKARVFTAYSAMYGIPATLGGITFGTVPMANYGDIREYALANNYNTSDKTYQALSEGLPTVIMNAISGHETSLQRFGPNATQLKDILDGKKGAAEMLGGASGSFVAQVAKTVWPAFMYGFSAFKKDSGFPLKMNDLTNLAENISTFNNAEKAVIGYNLGTYVSKTEGLLDNKLDTYESVLLSLGLNPQRVNDAYTKVDFIKHQEDAQKSLGKKMIEDWTLAMKAGLRGDYQTMTDYMTRVHGWSAAGNFTKQQEVDLYKQAMHGNESLVDSVERRFREANPALQNVPAYKLYLENRK